MCRRCQFCFYIPRGVGYKRSFKVADSILPLGHFGCSLNQGDGLVWAPFRPYIRHRTCILSTSVKCIERIDDNNGRTGGARSVGPKVPTITLGELWLNVTHHELANPPHPPFRDTPNRASSHIVLSQKLCKTRYTSLETFLKKRGEHEITAPVNLRTRCLVFVLHPLLPLTITKAAIDSHATPKDSFCMKGCFAVFYGLCGELGQVHSGMKG